MAFLNNSQINELCQFAHYSDMRARSELHQGYITGENDYTSIFTSQLRRDINDYSTTGLHASSYVLNNGVEQRVGSDAAIILYSNGQCKVALFEAKWPRLSSNQYSWDSTVQTPPNKSRFSNQLDKQSRCHGIFAIFEMFYCEYAAGSQPRYMMPTGSTCIWHDDAFRFKNNRSIGGQPNPDGVWHRNELIAMLMRDPPLGIADILYDVGICSKGVPLPSINLENLIEIVGYLSNILVISDGEVYEPPESWKEYELDVGEKSQRKGRRDV